MLMLLLPQDFVEGLARIATRGRQPLHCHGLPRLLFRLPLHCLLLQAVLLFNRRDKRMLYGLFATLGLPRLGWHHGSRR
jgi:hypothetical protein